MQNIMIFKDELAFFVRNETRNNTNTKKYDLLDGDFIFESTFKHIPTEESVKNEHCVVGRTGFNMGIFTQSTDAIKWCWWEVEEDMIVYKDIFINLIDNRVTNKLKVIKKNNTFKVYLNDVFKSSKEIGQLYDYSNQTIVVGVGNPYTSEYDPQWFNGEIYEVKIYHSSIEKNENLYLWYDFERSTNFKTFDKSENGNHGEIHVSHELIKFKNEEFNKIARPAKII